MPIRSFGAKYCRRGRTQQGTKAVDSMQDTQPSMRAAHVCHECISLRIKISDTQSREEEGGSKDGERGLPEIKSVGKALQTRANNESATHTKSTGDMDVGEGC